MNLHCLNFASLLVFCLHHVQADDKIFEFQGCFKFSNVYIYRLNKYEPMEGRKTVMFWSSRCCTARCQMDSHFQQGAKCLSGAACMVWADWQNMKQLAQSIIGLCCCFYLSHSSVFVFLFLLLSLFVYFFFCCWRCTPLQFSSDCLNNPTSFLFISVLLDVWSLDALVLHESVQCTVFPAQ